MISVYPDLQIRLFDSLISRPLRRAQRSDWRPVSVPLRSLAQWQATKGPGAQRNGLREVS